MRTINLTLEEWVRYGMAQGYCTDIVCDTHSGVEMTDQENEEWDEGFDPCIPVIRIWHNDDTQSPR